MEGALSIFAVLLVLFATMLDPRLPALIAALSLLDLGFRHFVKRRTRPEVPSKKPRHDLLFAFELPRRVGASFRKPRSAMASHLSNSVLGTRVSAEDH